MSVQAAKAAFLCLKCIHPPFFSGIMFPIVSREKAVSLPALRDLINQHFSAEELRQLCFGLSIEYENLPGGTRLAKVQPLAQYSPRHSQLPDLCQHCRQKRLV